MIDIPDYIRVENFVWLEQQFRNVVRVEILEIFGDFAKVRFSFNSKLVVDISRLHRSPDGFRGYEEKKTYMFLCKSFFVR